MLNPETLYVIRGVDDSILYARTPDGIGCYWYDEDQKEEAKNDVYPAIQVMRFDSFEEFDNYRDRLN